MATNEQEIRPIIMTLTEGNKLPLTHPNALVQWEPGKPPGGMPLNPASSQTPEQKNAPKKGNLLE